MRRSARILTVTLAIGALPAAAQSGYTEHRAVDVQEVQRMRDANARLAEARALFEKRDLAAARKQAGESLGFVPDLPEGHLLLAKIAYLEKDYTKALTEIESARLGHERLASLRARMEQDRLSTLRKKLSKSNARTSERHVPVTVTTAGGQEKTVVQTTVSPAPGTDGPRLEQLVTEPAGWNPEIPAEYDFLQGNVLLKMGGHTAAAAFYHEALHKVPAYTEAANNLASIYHAAGKLDIARDVVTKAEAAGATLNPELKKAIEEGLAKGK